MYLISSILTPDCSLLLRWSLLLLLLLRHVLLISLLLLRSHRSPLFLCHSIWISWSLLLSHLLLVCSLLLWSHCVPDLLCHLLRWCATACSPLLSCSCLHLLHLLWIKPVLMGFARKMVGSEENIDVVLVEYFTNVFLHVFNCVVFLIWIWIQWQGLNKEHCSLKSFWVWCIIDIILSPGDLDLLLELLRNESTLWSNYKWNTGRCVYVECNWCSSTWVIQCESRCIMVKLWVHLVSHFRERKFIVW